MIRPPRLRPGDRVALVSPSSGVAAAFPRVIEAARRALRERLGLELVPAPNALRGDPWLRDRPEARADDLHWALEEDGIRGLVSAIGGDDSVRILPHLDPERIRAHPKPFVGFSDATTVLTAFGNAGVIAFHGPAAMAGIATLGAQPYAERWLRAALMEGAPLGRLEPAPAWTEALLDWSEPDYLERADRPLPSTPGAGWTALQGDAPAAGPLIGGCVEVLEGLKGTPWWPAPERWRGAVLLLETSEEVPPPEAVERWLRDYASRGILQDAAGLLLARPRGYDAPMRARLADAVRRVLREAGRADLPVIADLDAGHTAPMLTLPLGARVALDPGGEGRGAGAPEVGVEVLEPGVA